MSNATVEVFKPDTGDKYTIPAGELAEAKAKGYAPVPASAAPLSTAVASPAANPVPLPADTHPKVSDADLTPDGHIRAFSQEGKEVHVVDEPGAIQTLRDKGYVLASDRALDAQTQARQQAADEERKAKLGIEADDAGSLLAIPVLWTAKSPAYEGHDAFETTLRLQVITPQVDSETKKAVGELKFSFTLWTPSRQEIEDKAREQARLAMQAALPEFTVIRGSIG